MNPIVAAWVLLSLLGGSLSLYLTRESWLDLHALPNRQNGRHVAAWSRFVREFLRITVHVAYLALGVPYLFSPFTGVSFFILALMWGNLVLVINSLIDARTRRLLFVTRDQEATISHGGRS